MLISPLRLHIRIDATLWSMCACALAPSITIINNLVDEIRMVESKKVSAVNHEAPEFLDSTMRSSSTTVLIIVIKGARAQTYIGHNIASICICSHRGDITIKVKL